MFVWSAGPSSLGLQLQSLSVQCVLSPLDGVPAGSASLSITHCPACPWARSWGIWDEQGDPDPPAPLGPGPGHKKCNSLEWPGFSSPPAHPPLGHFLSHPMPPLEAWPLLAYIFCFKPTQAGANADNPLVPPVLPPSRVLLKRGSEDS